MKMPKHITKEELMEALNASSAVNRTLWITFLLFLFYISVSVASTTDLVLFLPESIINLPIVNLNLPLKVYYFLAPLLILIFHFNLLTNLEKHAKKLVAFYSTGGGGEGVDLRMHPFLINYASKYSPYPGQSILRIIVRLSIFSLPTVILAIIQIRFADYHSWLLTTYHFTLVVADLILVVFQTEQVREVLRTREYPTFLGFNHWAQHLSKFLVIGISFFFYLLFIAVMLKEISPAAFSKYESIIPHLDLSGQRLVASEPEEKFIDYFIDNQSEVDIEKKIKDLQIKFTNGYDLRKRELSYANFSNANLTNAKLDLANLSHAQLEDAVLQGSSLIGAVLNNANLNDASLIKANLMKVDLRSAYLYSADLEGAFLKEADLSGAYLRRTNLIMANLEDASLIGSTLIQVDCSRGNLRGAKFLGAHVEDVNFQGALLIYSAFTAAKIVNGMFEALDLEGVDFQFVNFEKDISFAFSFLKSTSFKSAIDFNRLFLYTNYYKAVNHSNQLQSPTRTNIDPLRLSAAEFEDTLLDLAEQLYLPLEETTLANDFFLRMDQAQRGRVLLKAGEPEIKYLKSIEHLNQLRIENIKDPLRIQGILAKQFYSTSRSYPECEQVLRYYQANYTRDCRDIQKSIEEQIIFKEQCELSARAYPFLQR